MLRPTRRWGDVIERAWLRCLVHLRLHYQVLLAPIFLWGFLLAGGRPDARFWMAFAAFHVFLYGGTTAYNSSYDRDRGPVGGLAAPPPVPDALRPFSLAAQAVGAALAALVSVPFLLVYLVIATMGAAYSHPKTRLKGRPLLGLLTVGIGQGLLGALGGWFAARPPASIDATGAAGLLAVTLITAGFYPVTQIYQIAADVARGDRTFAAWAGPRRAFAFAVIVQGLGAATLVAVIERVLGLRQAVVVAVFYAPLLVFTLRWGARFDPADVGRNFARVMRINAVTSLGFVVFLAVNLAGR